jgi:hypothetical protein
VLGRVVALKVPRPETLAHPDLRERFLREAQAAARLDHPNVVPVHEAGAVGPVCYIVSAYCPGPTLAAWLKGQTEPIEPRLAVALVAVLAGAVQHAHEHGIFHRDLKPANVLLAPLPTATDGEPELPFIPRLTDFGLAKLLGAEVDQTTSGVLLGTLPYMAPEQAEGWTAEVGAATDVYALGVILYELLTGRLPFLGGSLLMTLEQVRVGRPESLRRLRPEVPRDLEIVCLKCLRRDPTQRYASAAALADDLQRYRRGDPIRARLLGLGGRLLNWCRRPERLRNAAGLALFHGAFGIGCNLIGFVLLLAGLLPITASAPAILYLLLHLFFFGPAHLGAAFGTLARRPLALWLGLFVPIVETTYQSSVAMGALPGGGISRRGDDPLAWEAMFATLVFLNVCQVLVFVVALLAYHANRHLPGFLPKQLPTPGRR